MDTKKVRKFKWFWAWQDEAEEVWLSEMSRQGWHLENPGLPGIYTFVGGEPTAYIYRLDFQDTSVDRGAYLQLFQDAGWDHVGEMSGWHYFRVLAQPGQAPEIFSDPESKIAKYRRVLNFLFIMFPVFLVSLIVIGDGPESAAMRIVEGVILLLFFLYIYVAFMIWRRINQLKRL